MRVLVTGGAGYIGSHTAKMLSRAGIEPIVLDNLSFGHKWAVRWGPLIEADLGSYTALREALAGVDAVIHFAASAFVGESMTDPQKYFHNNVVNTLALLDAMKESSVKTIVFSSTCATYGMPSEVPIKEDTPQAPVNPYGDSKLFVEKMLRWYGEAYGLRWMALRYFNAAGADPDGELGEDHTPETHLIPLVIQTAQGIRPHLDLYGTDYPTFDGTAVRDYIHVTDLADAHLRALRHLHGGGSSGAINLGTGAGTSILEIVRAVAEIANQHVPIRECARRPGDPAVLVANPSLALRILGWKPEYSDLRTIVRTAWLWHTRSGNAARNPT